MRDKEEFLHILNEIDRRNCSEYDQLIGDFDFSRYILKFGRPQLDRNQEFSMMALLRVPQSVAGFPAHLFNTAVRRTALEDLLTRKLAHFMEHLAHFDEQGLARRQLYTARPGQKILPRSSVTVVEDFVEARVGVNLPVTRGLIDAQAARGIFFDDLPELVNHSLFYCNLDEKEVNEFVDGMEDADAIRQSLPTRGWVGFIAEGALASRRPGTDEPDYYQSLPVSASEGLLSELQVPRAGSVRGIGIPAGVTLIVGDALSGRSELMRALASGIYNHIPGDGREMIITVPDAVYIKADQGRPVQRVNVSAFLDSRSDLGDLAEYTSQSCEAFTSQACSVVEMLEAGARVLLFDESDSVAEFLASDSRLASWCTREKGGIYPLAEHVNQLANELGVSLVIAGHTAVADLIPAADTILKVEQFKLIDITQETKAAMHEEAKAAKKQERPLEEHSRWVIPSSIDPMKGIEKVRVEATDLHELDFGRLTLDLSSLTQLAEIHQTQTIGLILCYLKDRYMDQPRPIREILDLIDRDLSTEGLDALTRDVRADLARPRRYEIAMTLNRLPSLRIAPIS
jgi:predicted ABC-class ATPase